jgi:peptidyl-prolyl cis-trans isomerase A (cyclophilin A)
MIRINGRDHLSEKEDAMIRLLLLLGMLVFVPAAQADNSGTRSDQPKPPKKEAKKDTKQEAKKDAKQKTEKETAAKGDRPRVKFVTNQGEFVIELHPDKAPKTVENFLRYVNEKFYDNTIFYKVTRQDGVSVVQAGAVTPEMEKKSQGLHPGIKCEYSAEMKNLRGTVGASRNLRVKQSAQADFYINQADSPALDKPGLDGKAYAIFAHVVEGMDTIDKIARLPLHAHPKYPQGGKVVPVDPVIIKSARLVTTDKKPEAPPKPGEKKAEPEKTKGEPQKFAPREKNN